MQIVCKKIDELPFVAEKILEKYPDERIFALRGVMGAGKTTFMQAVISQLGSTSKASSPTFAIVNEYETKTKNIIYHFDFYRIKDEKEAVSIGFDEYLYSGNYCFIEWAEKVENLLPKGIINIVITVNEADKSRKFIF
ncbi:MAG: tRNA (adenosine(37)-N6)-threonylcarbamoyltransferase complex ATPase subunit type 1 TsaE [Lentimicrobiaceae bacterium]|nr:tRNA (adenosine(37)-N6)-threonylcarbamoyltransferase complex ATPase subunit type 1 TsaE [Lentimicrobiaceae bacterium]